MLHCYSTKPASLAQLIVVKALSPDITFIIKFASFNCPITLAVSSFNWFSKMNNPENSSCYSNSNLSYPLSYWVNSLIPKPITLKPFTLYYFTYSLISFKSPSRLNEQIFSGAPFAKRKYLLVYLLWQITLIICIYELNSKIFTISNFVFPSVTLKLTPISSTKFTFHLEYFTISISSGSPIISPSIKVKWWHDAIICQI